MYYRTIILAGASFLALSVPAYADDKPSADSNQANAAASGSDIVVTARRKSEAAQDVPLVVNAVTSRELNKFGIHNMVDVASLVPGLSLANSANGVGSVATLRGVNFDVNASGNNGTVEFYLNDAPVSSNVVLQQMFDVGQIEVLRGPQGTLRGRASPSGSITVTTHSPDLENIGGYFESTVNGLGGVNAQGAVNVPIVKGVLALRVAALVDDDENNRVRSINDPNLTPFSHTRTERVSLRFAPTNNIDIIGTYQHFVTNSQKFDQVESANILNSALGSSPVNINAGQRESVENTPDVDRFAYNDFNVRAEWRFAGQKLSYVGHNSRDSWSSVNVADNDEGNYFGTAGFTGNANAPNNPFMTGFATVPNYLNAAESTHNSENQWTHELRLSSDERLFGMFDYVIGGMIDRSVTPFSLWSETPLFLVAVAPGAPYNAAGHIPDYSMSNVAQSARSLERSLFGNLTAHIGNATEISGGLRYINYNSQSVLTLQTSAAGGPKPYSSNNQTGNPVIYSASIKHRFSDNVMVYASTGSSWRASAQTNGIIDRGDPYAYGEMASLLHLAPEKSKSYEIGVKSEWLDKRLVANLTYYHQDFSNYFYSSPNVLVAQRTALGNGTATAAGSTDSFNLITTSPGLAVDVPVKVNGVEGELSYKASRYWNIGATFSYSLAKIHNGVIPCNLYPLATSGAALLAATGGQQVATCTTNSRAGVSPPFSATVQTEYNHPVSGDITGFVRGLLSYYGTALSDPANAADNYGRVSAYAPLNLYLGVRDARGGWELTAYVKNLFNVERVLTAGSNPLSTSAQVLSPPTYAATGELLTSTYRQITMTPPREFGITLHYTFGSH